VLLTSFLNKIFKLLIGVGSNEPTFTPSPIKILILSVALGFIFLLIVTALITTTGLML
jgi:high-affinity K+ transport system ATPase subunit B